MDSGGAPIEPFYFGAEPHLLFGCHHLPKGESARGTGVVLCSPVGSEYYRSHRTMQRLARQLSRANFHVLRFDYAGCGDSSGEPQDAGIAQWKRDIGNAVETLRERSTCERVALVGLRLGATLALSVAADRDDVDTVALSDPVLSGRDYLSEIQALHEQDYGSIGSNGDGEILGFPYAPALRAELDGIDLASQAAPALDVLVIDSSDTSSESSEATSKALAANVDFRNIPGPRFWIQDPDEAMVPAEALRQLVAWIRQRCA